MSNDQTTIPKNLRPLNIIAPPLPFADASSFFPNHSNSNGSPTAAATTTSSSSVFYSNPNPNPSMVPLNHHRNHNPIPNRIGGSSSSNAEEADDSASSSNKVKFLCSFGGKILPRPSDGVLRYAGGHTRIISVRRDISFLDLLRKMMDACGHPVIIKYQLPDEDLDALVSVSCPEDLHNMMDEYGKSSDGSAKLRVFLFSASELDDPMMHFTDLHDSGQRYVDAVNGLLDTTFTRRASTASATSTHNSDSLVTVADAVDGGGLPSSPAMLSPRVAPAASLDDTTTRLVYLAPNPVMYAENPIVTLAHTTLTLSSALPESELRGTVHAVGQQQSLGYDFHQPSGGNFAPTPAYTQAYVNPHQEASSPVDYPQFSPQIGYLNPQTYGMAGPFYRYVDHHPQQIQDNTGGFPPHQFIPAMHMKMASSTSNVNIRPSGAQQFMQPHQAWVNSYPEDNSFGTRIVQLPSENIHKAHEPHTSSLQAPIQLQARGYDRLQVPPSEHVVCSDGWASPQQKALPEKTIRLEDCYMCQKALPHAHSDTLVQDQRDSLMNTVSDSNPVFHSLCSEDISKGRALRRVVVSGTMGETAIEFQGIKGQPSVVGHTDQNVAAPQLGALGSGQSPEVQHDCENMFVPKRENFDHPRMCPPSGTGLAGDALLPYGLHLGKSAQLRQDGALPQLTKSFQCLVKQDPNLNNQLVSTNIHTKVIPFQSAVTQVHDSSTEQFVKHPALALREDISDTYISYDLRPDGRMEAVYINPPEVSVNNEQYNLPSNQIRKDEIWDIRSQMMGKEAYLTNAFSNPGAAPGENHLELVKPVQAPASSPELVYLHDLQPVESIQITQPVTLGISGPYPHLDTAVQHTNSGGMWNGKLTYSGVDSAYATDRISPVGERRDEDPQFHSRIVSNNSASVPRNGNSPSALSPLSGIGGDDRDLVPSNSLFSNQDPWALPHGAHFPPPRPNKVLMGIEAFVTGDEVVLPQLSGNLQKDFRLEHGGYTKDSSEDHIKQELQAVAEGVAASVLQSSIPSDVSSLELIEPIPEANQHGESCNDSAEVQSTAEAENVKTKLLDKTSPGLPISDDIGRLQIIKNIDLEELRELGSGTFGTVYHGKWRGTDVAIKRINDRCFTGKPSEQDRMRDDFWNEAIKLADLHHPNVVAFYGVVLDSPGGSVATVTEYMVNGSLRQAIQRNDRTLDKRKRVLIAMDVAFGMEYLHGKNIVHFDLKSDNLLVNLRDPHRPICKVGDLGLSKVKCQTLISGGVRGTLPWMAPELLNGSSNLVSEKVDVFSFGIVMWELLTGEEPYADLHYGAIIGGIVSNTLRPTVQESCDPEWRSLMESCWSAEPSDRPNFTEIANHLRSMAGSLPSKDRPKSDIR